MPRLFILLAGLFALTLPTSAAEPDLASAVTFYASFDEGVRGDRGGGVVTPSTRFNDPKNKGVYIYEYLKIDPKVFRIAKGNGISGGALEVLDVLPNNGRIFFLAKGNLAFKKEGWSGSLSLWCNTDPDKLLKTGFCDPIQITQLGANNGGLWFDFNDAKPRDLRHGAFPVIPPGGKKIEESDPTAPMVHVPRIGWKAGDWHHIVVTWKNLDSGKADAVTALYIDGKLIGEVKDRAIAMGWDIDKAGIYLAVNYIGLLDEFALFNRSLTIDEVKALMAKPGMLKK